MRRYLWSVVPVALTVALSVGVGAASAGGGNSAKAKLCQKGGWMNLVRSDGSTFASEGACVSHAAQGGSLTDSNLVANPSFTDDCSGIPCNWSPVGGSVTIARDTVDYRTAPASLAVTMDGFASGGTLSNCFPVSPSTAYSFGGYYSTTVSGLEVVGGDLVLYSDASCANAIGGATSGGSIVGEVATPVATGAWTPFQTTGTTGLSAHSAQLDIGLRCFSACTSTVNYDDVFVRPTP